MNALPELKPIEIAIVQRPTFDNSRLGSPRAWVEANADLLARYFHQQTQALDEDERATSSDGEFDVWQLIQHDIELQRKRPDNDPTPWCSACGAMVKARCHCGDIADCE